MKKLLTITLVLFIFVSFSSSAFAQRHKRAASAKASVHKKSINRDKKAATATRRSDALHPKGWRPSLHGSRASQIRQNRVADAEGLTRIKNGTQLHNFERKGILVPLPQSKGLRIDSRLAGERRYVRRHTSRFLVTMGAKYHRKFHSTFQINSGVRTQEFQEKMKKKGPHHNGNAAAVTGPTASSHLTGATVDIARNGLSRAQEAWIADYLLRCEKADTIEVTKERAQPVFHFMVFEKSGAGRPAKEKTVRNKPVGKKSTAQQRRKSDSSRKRVARR